MWGRMVLVLTRASTGNEKCKIFWHFGIQTDKEIEHRRLDILVIDKEKRECKIIDIAVPGNQNIKLKELEKITK